MTNNRSNCEIAYEVSWRAVMLKEGGRQRCRRALAAAGTLCFALLAYMSMLPNRWRADEIHTVQASALDLAADATTGGYVLVGVVCFILGITVALVCVWAAKKK